MIIFASEEKVGFSNGQSVSYLTSQFFTRMKGNLAQIEKRKDWKTLGSGARFMGIYNPEHGAAGHGTTGVITGLTFTEGPDSIVYSISVNECSGILRKDLSDEAVPEGHIIHKEGILFGALDYCSKTGRIITSVSDSIEKHLALFQKGSSIYEIITEGESVDENPSWSPVSQGAVYYDSCGIAFNSAGTPVDFSPRVICRLNLSTGALDEVVSLDRYDCIKPREDRHGNLYFIKKPYAMTRPTISPISILLAPFLVLKAVFNWISVFTMFYTGEKLSSGGGVNPARNKKKNPREIFIEGNLVNAEKALKENKARGEEFPGIIPGSWELVKRDPRGGMKTVRKGVADFDINSQGEIIFSNGKHLLKIGAGGKEQGIGEAPLAARVRTW